MSDTELARRKLGRYIGGYLRDIPKPHVRRWPSPTGELREVRVRVGVYDIVGGQHYYPDVWEEDNPIWNSIRLCWQVAWDDVEAKGRSYQHAGFERQMDARQWIANILAEHFPSSAYKVFRAGGMRAFYYRHPGD